MNLRHAVFFAATVVGALGVTASASAEVIATYSSTVGTSNSQLGRLSRNGIAQDWTGGETYPGVINTGTAYSYTTYDLTPTQLEFGQYIQIEMDSTSGNTFLSAYSGSYNPLNKQTGWLGDPGSSGNSFGTDPLFFQVYLPAMKDLILVVTNTAAGGVGTSDPFTITVESFTDTEFTDPVVAPPTSPVPEPSTLVLLGSGIAGMAGAVRRRFKA